MHEIVIDHIVSGLIGLRHIVSLHKRKEEVLIAKEGSDLTYGIALLVDERLRQAEVDENEQAHLELGHLLPADIRDTGNDGLGLLSGLSREEFHLLLHIDIHHGRIGEVIGSNIVQQTG